MPEQRVVDSSFGSRHRAALGITEETDAVVVIVSEERGNISFCFNGNIASNLDGHKLRTMLEAVFSPKAVRKRAAKVQRAAVPVPAAETRHEVEEGAPVAVRAETTPLALVKNRVSTETDEVASVRPKGIPEITEDTLRMRPRESEPPRLRRGGESEHPTPLRTRPGIDDAAFKIPKAAKVPGAMPRVIMPTRSADMPTPSRPVEVSSVRTPPPNSVLNGKDDVPSKNSDFDRSRKRTSDGDGPGEKL